MNLEKIIKKIQKGLIIGSLALSMTGCFFSKIAFEELAPRASSPQGTYQHSELSNCEYSLYSENFYFRPNIDTISSFDYSNTKLTFRVFSGNPTSEGVYIHFCYSSFNEILYSSRKETFGNALMYKHCDNKYLESEKTTLLANDYPLKYFATYSPYFNEVKLRVTNCP